MKTIIKWLVIFSLFCFPISSFAEGYEYHHIFPRQYFSNQGDNITFQLRYVDHRFVHSKYSSFNSLTSSYFWGYDDLSINSRNKRKVAIAAGRGIPSYGLATYSYNNRSLSFPFLLCFSFDGVSNVLYNLSYILSIPNKLIYATIFYLSKDYGGLWELIILYLNLAFGLCAALFLIVFGFFTGLICHPLETLANLTINLFGTIWDLFVGAIIGPFWDILATLFRLL